MTDKGCGCWCSRHSEGKRPAPTESQVWGAMNATGWYTAGQIARRVGMDGGVVNALLDSGAFGGRVRHTKGGHRRVHISVEKMINEMTAERYRLLMGFGPNKLPKRGVPWDETVEDVKRRRREKSQRYRARRKAEIAEFIAADEAIRAGRVA